MAGGGRGADLADSGGGAAGESLDVVEWQVSGPPPPRRRSRSRPWPSEYERGGCRQLARGLATRPGFPHVALELRGTDGGRHVGCRGRGTAPRRCLTADPCRRPAPLHTELPEVIVEVPPAKRSPFPPRDQAEPGMTTPRPKRRPVPDAIHESMQRGDILRPPAWSRSPHVGRSTDPLSRPRQPVDEGVSNRSQPK